MKQCVDKSKPCCFLLPNKKVSRETFVNLREKRANRPFCATILKKKRLFEHNFAAIGGVFIIFLMFYKILWFFIFLVAMSTVFWDRCVFCCWFPFFVWKVRFGSFLFAFCTNMGFVGCDWRSILIDFAWIRLFWPVFCFLAGRLCHFRAFYCFFAGFYYWLCKE